MAAVKCWRCSWIANIEGGRADKAEFLAEPKDTEEFQDPDGFPMEDGVPLCADCLDLLTDNGLIVPWSFSPLDSKRLAELGRMIEDHYSQRDSTARKLREVDTPRHGKRGGAGRVRRGSCD